MFGIGMPEVIILTIVSVFLIVVVTAIVVLTVFLVKKIGSTQSVNKTPDLFCPKCGARLNDNAPR
jgi:hypothetical protein